MEIRWADLKIPDADFDIAALHAALDALRSERGMSWKAVADEVNRAGETSDVHPISPSTISGMKSKRYGVEGDGVLQMLLWLDRSPESFVPGHPGAGHSDARLPRVTGSSILRFDVPAISAKLDAQRAARALAALPRGCAHAHRVTWNHKSLCEFCAFLWLILCIIGPARQVASRPRKGNIPPELFNRSEH
jgi:hypothetical protein